MIKMTYYIQAKTKPFKQSVNVQTSKLVSCFFLGRQVNQYIVIKSDESGDRIVKLVDSDIMNIESICDDA